MVGNFYQDSNENIMQVADSTFQNGKTYLSMVYIKEPEVVRIVRTDRMSALKRVTPDLLQEEDQKPLMKEQVSENPYRTLFEAGF